MTRWQGTMIDTGLRPLAKSDGAGGVRAPHPAGELAVADGLAVGDVLQVRPDRALEVGALEPDRDVEFGEVAAEVGVELADDVGEPGIVPDAAGGARAKVPLAVHGHAGEEAVGRARG